MPTIYKKEFSNGLQIGVWQINETENELISKLTLSKDELSYLESIQSSKRYKHWLASRVLIKDLLQTDEFIEFEYNKTGKPNLVNVDGFVSISHAADVAAIALSKKHEVGIDIEKMQEKIVRIAPKFMLPEEIEECNENNKVRAMYVHWCIREAVFKCYGKGQLDFKKHILLEAISSSNNQCVKTQIKKENEQLSYNVYYDVLDEYMLAYTMDENS